MNTSSFGSITDKHFLPGRVTFNFLRRLLFSRSLGQSQCPARKFPSLSKSPGRGGRPRFEVQQVNLFRLSYSPVHLLLHSCLIVLQEGKPVKFEVQASRIEVFRLRLFDRSPGLFQPIQIDIAVDEVVITQTARI